MEPEACENCGSTEPMTLMEVVVSGERGQAYICWDCGHAHMLEIELDKS